MELIECIKTRRSVRKFTDKPVSKEIMTDIISAAAFAPSWKNSQTARWNVIMDKAVIDKIAAEATFGLEHNRDIILGCPCLVVQSVVTKRCGYERDGSFTTSKGDSWEMYDSGIAGQTFSLAAHNAGLGSVIMGIIDDVKIAEIIGLPETERITAAIAVGYPESEPQCPPKKTAEDISRFI
ncbi:MAG: nitroreductase family protein [Oscillospiraceae bacterium]|nr:nitroreductase family protein [Oscillospiraceae bacterium]